MLLSASTATTMAFVPAVKTRLKLSVWKPFPGRAFAAPARKRWKIVKPPDACISTCRSGAQVGSMAGNTHHGSVLEGIAAQQTPEIAEVVVELPLETPLDYRITQDLRTSCQIGQRVLVPLGKRQILGYIVGLTSTSPVADLKDVIELLDDTPLLTPALLQLTRWIADYYLCPWWQVLKAAVPEGFRVHTDAVYSLMAQAQGNPQAWPQGRAGEVLQSLAQHGGQRQHELERRLGVPALASVLRRLQHQGPLCRQQQRLAPKTQPRLVTVVRACLPLPEAQALQQQVRQRSPSQATVLALLQEQPEWEMAALRQRLPGAPAAVKRLAARAAVEVVQVEKM